MLRHWRQHNHLSQLALALQAEVSARHLSWLETGKAQPSRAMVLRLAEQLQVPLRERNALLVAAGFAPLFSDRPLADPALAQTLQRLLEAHEPWPALAVNPRWELVAHNRMVDVMLSSLPAAVLQPPLNMLRLSLHPEGLAPQILNYRDWRNYTLLRLQRQAAASGDPVLLALWHELKALPPPTVQPRQTTATEPNEPAASTATGAELAMPLRLRSPLLPQQELSFITTVTTFGSPHDATLADLAIETLLPADAATADILRQLHQRGQGSG